MKYLSFLLIAALTISSCNIVDQRLVKGDGNIISKNYNLKNFASVEVEDAMEVHLKQDSSFSVKIETDENILNLINVNIEDDNKLVIENRDNVNLSPTGEIKIYISMPWANKISLSGASQLQTEGQFSQDKKIGVELSGASSGNISIRAPMVDIEASGASTLHVEGECRDISAEAVGASTINAFNLLSENGKASASGASTVRVFSSISLTADASGASSIKYKGNPKVTADASGASSISKQD